MLQSLAALRSEYGPPRLAFNHRALLGAGESTSHGESSWPNATPFPTCQEGSLNCKDLRRRLVLELGTPAFRRLSRRGVSLYRIDQAASTWLRIAPWNAWTAFIAASSWAGIEDCIFAKAAFIVGSDDSRFISSQASLRMSA
jgi:hypothetical protein